VKILKGGPAARHTVCALLGWKRGFLERAATFRKRLRRFGGLISFCDAALVLTTFIIKDVLRDREKDVVSGMENAQRDFDSLSIANAILSRLDALAGKPVYAESSLTAVADWKSLQLLYDYLNERHERLKVLMDVLPMNWRELVQNRAFVVNGQRISDDDLQLDPEIWLSKLEHDLGRHNDSAGPTTPKDLDDTDNKDPLESAQADAQKASKLVDVESMAIFARFQDETQIAKNKLKQFTFWSYFLYPFGVFIGILGQLAGVKVGGSE